MCSADNDVHVSLVFCFYRVDEFVYYDVSMFYMFLHMVNLFNNQVHFLGFALPLQEARHRETCLV